MRLLTRQNRAEHKSRSMSLRSELHTVPRSFTIPNYEDQTCSEVLTLSSDQLHKIDIDKKAPRLTVICHLLQNLKCGSLGATQASLLQ